MSNSSNSIKKPTLYGGSILTKLAIAHIANDKAITFPITAGSIAMHFRKFLGERPSETTCFRILKALERQYPGIYIMHWTQRVISMESKSVTYPKQALFNLLQLPNSRQSVTQPVPGWIIFPDKKTAIAEKAVIMTRHRRKAGRGVDKAGGM